ncbi:hypothetical protein K4K57_003830 [Colletotrichum sp. SAR 10_99]|nr:hypothetical protein K4K55_004397 [Colletotrichum sp. SAR 10_96]KAI8266880.1 hypothetical protein K4K56_004669 [Colletotrichum sp. SAR 10_98]KAJ5012713.1 hypothetical protein K4K57_003830 [Colletotrichum sp. SAR 10_99]
MDNTSLIFARDAHGDVHNRGMTLFAVQLSFLIAAGLFTLARAYVKVRIVKSVGADDYLIFLAMIMYTVYGAVALHGVIQGATGKHLTELTVEQAAISLRAWYICEVIYSPITLAIRTSICLLLLRLALNKVHRWVIYVNMAIVLLISIAYFFIMTFQCSPPSYFWRQLYGEKGKCINYNIVPDATIAHSIISAVSDWCIGLLPIALLWNVNLNRRTKALVAVLLSMGMVAGVALIIRIPFIRRLAISTDFLYETIDIAIWTVLEPALGIIAASVTSMRPLFQGWGFGWSTNSKHSRPSGPSSGHPINKEAATPRTKGITDHSDSTARTYDDIERALSPEGSDIELNKTAREDRGSDEHEYPESRPSSDLGQRYQHREPQPWPRPVINVCTTIDITSHSIDHVLPSTTCVSDHSSSDDDERPRREEKMAHDQPVQRSKLEH